MDVRHTRGTVCLDHNSVGAGRVPGHYARAVAILRHNGWHGC